MDIVFSGFSMTEMVFCNQERKTDMPKRKHFTPEEKAELLSNPYTFRITDCKIVFTLEFKQLVIANIGKPGMTHRKIFQLAGYRDELFSDMIRRYTIAQIRKEAALPEGLQAPAPQKEPVRKKHSETEFRELEERVRILEQQVSFLKKNRHLKNTGSSIHPSSSN